MSILSLDFGTSSLKLALVDREGRIERTARVPYAYRLFDGNKVEIGGDVLMQALFSGIHALETDKRDIELICFCTFSPSGVYMDGSGELLQPVITHLDRRAAKESAEVVKRFGAKAFQQITGLFPFNGGASMTTLLWMYNNRPDLMRRVKTYGHLPTWLYRQMTGVTAMDPVNASMSGLYETLTDGGWSRKILDAFSIDRDILPALLPIGTKRGLSARFALESGLIEGTPVAFGTNDVAASLVGAGCVTAGSALNVCGSSEMISVITDKPVANDKYYLRKAAIDGQWQCYSTMVGGFALDWFQKQFCREMDEAAFYGDYLNEVVKSHAKGTAVNCLPFLMGDRQSLRKRRGGFGGLTLGSTREDMLYSLLLGMNEHIKTTLALVEENVPLTGRLAITGGLANDSIIQMKKKLFAPLQLVRCDDCSLTGNVQLALRDGK